MSTQLITLGEKQHVDLLSSLRTTVQEQITLHISYVSALGTLILPPLILSLVLPTVSAGARKAYGCASSSAIDGTVRPRAIYDAGTSYIQRRTGQFRYPLLLE